MIIIEKYYELLKGFWISISEHGGWRVFESAQEPIIMTFRAHAGQMWYMYRVLWLRSYWKPNKPRWSTQGPLAMMTKEENLRSVGSCEIKMGTALPFPTTKCQCLLLTVLV